MISPGTATYFVFIFLVAAITETLLASLALRYSTRSQRQASPCERSD